MLTLIDIVGGLLLVVFRILAIRDGYERKYEFDFSIYEVDIKEFNYNSLL